MQTGTTVFRDIHGLDVIPWWPLAAGWWYLVGLAGLLLLLAGIRYWLFYNASWLGWRGDARRQLRELKQALPAEDPQEVAVRLSELLRRIALVRSGHRQPASLTGDSWLYWLMAHDNTGFDWERHGQLLLSAPYMPPTMSVERKQLATLIRAAIRWIDASRPVSRQTGFLKRLKGLLPGKSGKYGESRV